MTGEEIVMDVRKRLIGTALFCLMGLLTACASGGGTEADTAGNDYRQEFTDSELEEGYASFAIADHLSIDAELTPKELYQDGLNSYYMEDVYEEGDISDLDASECTLFGLSQEEFVSKLSGELGASYEWEDLEWENAGEGSALSGSIYGETGMEYTLWIHLSYGAVLQNPGACHPELYIRETEADEDPEYYSVYYMQQYLKDSSGECTFTDNSKEEAESWKSRIEEMTGRTLCDTWDVYAGNEENRNELVSVLEAQGDNTSEYSAMDEFMAYLFYYDIDGLPFDNLYLSYTMKDNETCTSEARYGSSDDSSNLQAVSENAQWVIINEDGPVRLDMDSFRYSGEIYKEDQTVISASEILGKIASYYDTKLLADEVTITQMRLVYSGYFTDGADGIIDTAICPYWKITIYDAAQGANLLFVYDAITGEVLKEAIYVT